MSDADILDQFDGILKSVIKNNPSTKIPNIFLKNKSDSTAKTVKNNYLDKLFTKFQSGDDIDTYMAKLDDATLKTIGRTYPKNVNLTLKQDILSFIKTMMAAAPAPGNQPNPAPGNQPNPAPGNQPNPTPQPNPAPGNQPGNQPGKQKPGKPKGTVASAKALITKKIKTTQEEIYNQMGLRELQQTTKVERKDYPIIEERIKMLKNQAKQKAAAEEALKLEKEQKLEELGKNMSLLDRPNSNSLEEAVNFLGGAMVETLNKGNKTNYFDENLNKPDRSNLIYQSQHKNNEVRDSFYFPNNNSVKLTNNQKIREKEFENKQVNMVSRELALGEIRPQAIGSSLRDLYIPGRRMTINEEPRNPVLVNYQDVILQQMGYGRHSLYDIPAGY